MKGSNLPEIVFASSNTAESQRISRWVKAGILRRLVPRVYTSNLKDDDQAIISRNLYLILGRLFPGAVISHRTALEGRPTEKGDLFLTYRYSRRVVFPGMRVHLLKGSKPAEGDMPFMEGLFMASRPRAFLENLQVSRNRSDSSKILPKAALEDRLDRLCQIQGEDALNTLRDKARVLAPSLHMEAQFDKLNAIIGAILRSRPAGALSSPRALARSHGAPYDPNRLDVFNRLFTRLTASPLPARKEQRLSPEETRLMAFFEAYFSNYIEGTEFEVAEAYDIVFKNRIPERRPQDAHDIMGTFRVVGNPDDRQRTPRSFEGFVDLMKARHHVILEARPEKSPGEFKSEPNRAGQTHFVAPELVGGTLREGFEMCSAVEPGLARAIFVMFVTAEVHPFTDGNGRVARIMMNAELTSGGFCRIIVPTALRDDYLLALRALSRSGDPDPIVRVMDFAQRFAAEVPLSSYEAARAVLAACNAFDEPDEGKLRMPGQFVAVAPT